MNVRRVPPQPLHAWLFALLLVFAPAFVAAMAQGQSLLPDNDANGQNSASNDNSEPGEPTAPDDPLGLTGETQPTEVLEAEVEVRDGSLEIEPPALDSPRATMAAFLRGMELVNRGYDAGYQLVYPTLASPDREPPVDNLRDAAEKLLGVLNRIERVDVLELPGKAELRQIKQEHPDNLPLKRWQYFPQQGRNAVWERLEGGAPRGRIALARGDDGEWRFTSETVRGIDELYESLETLAPVHSEPTLAPSGQFITIIGPTFERTPLWAWGALLGLIFIGLAAGKLLQSAFAARAERHRRKDRPMPATLIASFGSPVSLVCITLGLNFGLQMIEMDPRLQEFTRSVLVLLYIAAGGWLLYNLVDVIDLLLRRGAERTRSKLDDQVAPLVRKSLRIFLVVLVSLMVAQNVFGLNITGWIAGLGIVGLAISLAAQDSVRNLFGSITVLFDKPFAVGDWVKVGDVEGTVEEVGFRSTRIRTFYNSQITYPNSNLINASVDNMGRRKYRRWSTHVGVQYDTPPEKLVAFTEGIRELIRTHPYTRKDYYQVWMHQWSDSSMDVLLYVFFEVPDWNTELRERDRLFVDIVRLADRLGVEFAFPTRTVHLFQEQHAEPEAKYEPPQSMTDRRSMVEGIRAAQTIDRDQPWMREKPGPVVYGQEGPTDIELTDAGDPVPQSNASDDTDEPPNTAGPSDADETPHKPSS